MFVELSFTTEVSLFNVPGSAFDVECVAISEDDSPIVEDVFVVSIRWEGSHANNTARTVETRIRVNRSGHDHGDPVLDAIAGQILAEATGAWVTSQLCQKWREVNGPKSAQRAATACDSQKQLF